MLRELHIQNFAIIQDLTLEFGDGLIVFTGETGAGKSIILDALSAILGERMDATAIRKGADKAVVEGTFTLEGHTREAVEALLEEEGLLDEPGMLSLGREIRGEGRSIARVNGRSVSLSLQSALGALLVDLHGQSEHLSLLKVKQHLVLLDRFAHNDAQLMAYKATYQEWAGLQDALNQLLEAEKTASQRLDMLHYQVQEISAAKLLAGEEESLRQERTRLANAEALSQMSRSALANLDEGGPESSAATDLLGEVVRDLNELARIDPNLASMAERADQALSGLADLAYELRGYAENIEFNPRRLDQIEERLNLVALLKRKYGGSIQSALDYLRAASGELEKIEHAEDQLADIGQKLEKVKIALAQAASELSESRKRAAQDLTKGMEAQLGRLQMKSAHFLVRMQQEERPDGLALAGRNLAFDSTGIDHVEFLVETNPGEGFKPLAKIASGGETSRLMLALKHVLAEVDQIPTLVFDEIDSGIGGKVGATMGGMLWQLGREHQVMCVTHLPQLAGFGDQHFHVSKQEADGRTFTRVRALEGEDREQELAQMIGTLSAGTRQSAREILASARQITGKIES